MVLLTVPARAPADGQQGFLSTILDESQDGSTIKEQKDDLCQKEASKIDSNAVCAGILPVALAKSNCLVKRKRAQPVQRFLK